jgi:major membrane immunogen (membrane-anchored lipoprotein)
MKKLSIAIIASLFLITSCGKKSEEGTHTHDDGTEHADHSDTTKQEEFNAADTTEHAQDTTKHDHPHPH